MEDLFLNFCFPQAVQVAVRINSDQLVILQCKGYNRLLSRLDGLALAAMRRLQIYPSNIMLFRRWMLNASHADLDNIPIHLNHRQVLLRCALCGVGDQFAQLFPTANQRHAGIMNKPDNIPAMLANIEFHFFAHPFDLHSDFS